MTTAERIDAFLAEPAIAVAGVSRSKGHFGNAACRALRNKGYRVYAIHPTAAEIDGMQCYRRFDDLPEHVGAALVVVPPPDAIGVIEDAAQAGIRHIWLQQGAESHEAIEMARRLGLEVVSGECILMFAQPTGIHRAHRFVRRVMHTLAT